MIYWAPLLHFYQPPIQLHWILDKVCEESYRPLIEMFRNNPSAKVTVNICGALTELLAQHGKSDINKGFTELAEKGQLEFTASAKYHPILPLIPGDEILRQITLNNETNRRLLGPVYSPRGFFPPEQSYSADIIRPIIETGCEWIVLSGIACPVEWPLSVLHQVQAHNGRLNVFFRDDILSNMISFRNINAHGFLQHLAALGGAQKDVFVITAMDAETFGHHIKNWEKLFLEEVYQALGSKNADLSACHAQADPVEMGVQQLRTLVERQRKAFSIQAETEGIKVVTISQLLSLFPAGSLIEPRRSSWSTMDDDLKAGIYYPLWDDPGNQIHQLLWTHLRICIHMVEKAMRAADNETSRYHASLSRSLLDRALHSDQFWWASRRPNWDINMINRGLMQQHSALLNAYKAIRTSGMGEEEKIECYYREVAARDTRGKIRDLLFRL